MASENEKELYVSKLEDNLRTIMIPAQISNFHDPHFKIEEHQEAIDWYSAQVLEAVQRAGEESFPFPKAVSLRKGKKVTHGFDTNVKHFKEDAYFWHSVWKSAGRPLNTQFIVS